MVEPARVPGEHVVFVCGNDSEAKDEATRFLGEVRWPAKRVLNLSDVTATRGTEMYIPLWLNPVLLAQVLSDRTPLHRTSYGRYSASFRELPFLETELSPRCREGVFSETRWL